jgi:Tfp pilus assembly protein PilF
LASLAFALSGCQPLSNTVDKFSASLAVWRRPTPKSPGLLGHETPSAPLTAQQKADVEFAVAQSLEDQGQTDHAIQTYLGVLKKDKRRADAHHRLAILYDQKGDFDASKKHFQAALKQTPNNADLQCDYGYHCYLQQRWPDAEASLRKALALNSSLPRAHNNLGLVLARTGNEDEALREFAKAGCSEAECHANLGFGLAAENHWSRAHLHFQHALQLDPNCRMAQNGLTVLQSVTRNAGQPAAGPGHGADNGSVVPTAFFGSGN